MKSLIVISVIVGAVTVFGIAGQQADYRDSVEDTKAFWERTCAARNYTDRVCNDRIEGAIRRSREATLVGSFGVGGVILLWLFTSVATWACWKFLGLCFRGLWLGDERAAERRRRREQYEDAWYDEAEQQLRATRHARRAEASRMSGRGARVYAASITARERYRRLDPYPLRALREAGARGVRWLARRSRGVLDGVGC